jgi:hypothetical protein
MDTHKMFPVEHKDNGDDTPLTNNPLNIISPPNSDFNDSPLTTSSYPAFRAYNAEPNSAASRDAAWGLHKDPGGIFLC